MFQTKIINKFDDTQFEKFYNDSVEALDRNLWISEKTKKWSENEKREYLIDHYKTFFGLKAKLEGKFVFVVYKTSNPDYELLYCSATKHPDIKALEFNICMTRKDLNNSKLWIKSYFSSKNQFLKPLVSSCGMDKWYFTAHITSDFMKDSLYNNDENHKLNTKIPMKKTKVKVISSVYGWENDN
jgi:hypothetical protein